MNAPELIQQQRELITHFRKASLQRSQSEESAKRQQNQDQTAVDTLLQQLEQAAQTQLQHATTESEAKLNAEKQLAEAKLEQTRAQRQIMFVVAAAAILVAVVFASQAWQRRQARLQVQATATAIATAIAVSIKPLEERFNMRFVVVPAGEFITGWGNRVELESFLIGITEVTNAQFRGFVEGDGYRNQRYWTTAGWQWRIEEKVIAPSCWTDKNFNGDNQPVVCVSLHEAVAYTRWLANQTQLPIRLPSKEEFEKAANGVDRRKHPWGNQEPTADLANYGSNVGKTKDVGSYPGGASPYGALDMVGNVQEWSVRDGQENLNDVEGGWPSGGSWEDDSDRLCGLCGYDFYAGSQASNTGFRVVISVSPETCVSGLCYVLAP